MCLLSKALYKPVTAAPVCERDTGIRLELKMDPKQTPGSIVKTHTMIY